MNMRTLTLDQKISLKGALAKQGVLPSMYVDLDVRSASKLTWTCFGVPLAWGLNQSQSQKLWRHSYQWTPETRNLVLNDKMEVMAVDEIEDLEDIDNA